MALTGQDGNRGSIVSVSSIIAAGLASALAAAVTSSAGWAGGLLGAAITTMIITGGTAILNAYLQSMNSRMRAAPGSIRAAAQRVRPRADQRVSGPGFVNRLWGALGWFSRLPTHQRRSVLKRGLIGASAAFVIGVISITALEYGIGNSLSCGIWSNCPSTSAPGFNGGNAYVADGARSNYSILANNSAGGGVTRQDPYVPQNGGIFGGNQQQTPQQPVQPRQDDGSFFGGGQQTPQQPVPQQPVPQQPEEPVVPAEPVEPEAPAVPEEGAESAP